jgi:hypothetical protein
MHRSTIYIESFKDSDSGSVASFFRLAPCRVEPGLSAVVRKP